MKVKNSKKNSRVAYWNTPTAREQVCAEATVETKLGRCTSLKGLQRLAAEYEVPGRSKWRNSTAWNTAVQVIKEFGRTFKAMTQVARRSR